MVYMRAVQAIIKHDIIEDIVWTEFVTCDLYGNSVPTLLSCCFPHLKQKFMKQ